MSTAELIAAIQRMGLSQTDIAHRTGMGQATVSRALNGDGEIWHGHHVELQRLFISLTVPA